MKTGQKIKNAQLGIVLLSGLLLAPVFVFAEGVLEEIVPNTKIVVELDTLSFVASTTDGQFVSFFTLAGDPPSGAGVDSQTGVFSWTPNIEQGPETYDLTILAHDDTEEVIGSASFVVEVLDRDISAPNSTIFSPKSNSIINDYAITISGNTTDNNAVASTTLAFAPQLMEGDFLYCGQYEPIISLLNSQGGPEFNWTYDWAPENGNYCIRAYSEDSSGNFEREPPEVVNVSFTKRIDPVVPPPEPTPTPTPIPGGRRHPVTTPPGQVLGASTEVPELKTVDIVWTTNVPATSGVIYGLTVAGPYNLNTNATNFGYPFSTGENDQKVLNHRVSISGIVVGQSYSVRVVSSVTGPNFGPEYRFIVNQDGTVKTQGIFGGELIIKNTAKAQETLKEFVERNDPKVQVVMDEFLDGSLKASTKSATTSTSTNQLASVITTEEFTWTGFINFIFGKIGF